MVLLNNGGTRSPVNTQTQATPTARETVVAAPGGTNTTLTQDPELRVMFSH